jgi:hypothetical protein
MMARWHLRWLIQGALLVAAFGLSPAHASCAAPTVLLDRPSKLRAGDALTVRGENWTNECNDSCGVGCVGDRCVDEPVRPLRNMTIWMTSAPGKLSIGLGGFLLAEGVDAASDLTFDLDVSIPTQAPGAYRLSAQAVDSDHLIFGSRFRVVE